MRIDGLQKSEFKCSKVGLGHVCNFLKCSLAISVVLTASRIIQCKELHYLSISKIPTVKVNMKCNL